MPPENHNYSHLVRYFFAFIVILAVAGAIYYFNFKTPPIYAMSGNVSSVGGNAVLVIHGVVAGKEKDVTFRVTPETIFNNNANTISMAQIKSGEHFQPQFEKRPGLMSDMVKGLAITNITSAENLLVVDKATAVEIDYATFIPPAK